MAEAGRGRWLGLAMLSLGVAMIIVDATIVNVSVPAIIADLDLSACGERCPQVIASAVSADLITHGALHQLGESYRARVLYSDALTGEVLIDELIAAPSLEALEGAEGVIVCEGDELPTTVDVVGQDDVWLGRVRLDPSRPHALNFWCAADNLRKGAASNAVQIAERLIELDLMRVPELG